MLLFKITLFEEEEEEVQYEMVEGLLVVATVAGIDLSILAEVQ